MIPRASKTVLELSENWPKGNVLVDRLLAVTWHETQCKVPEGLAMRFGEYYQATYSHIGTNL